MQRKDNKRNKLDIWAHDINVSIESDNLIENIIENIYRYIMDFKPYSIVITRRKTEKEKNRTYYLKPTLKIYVDLDRDIIRQTISKWTYKDTDAIEKIVEADDWENKLLEHYNNQDISDDVLLFKLYKDQLKDDQIIIITDKYSAGYFKSLQETTNGICIRDINSTQTALQSGRAKNDEIEEFTKLEELILIPNIEEERWTACSVRLSWFDEFIGNISIIFNGQPSYKSFRGIINYLHKVKDIYVEEIMRLILKKAKESTPDNGDNNFKNILYRCIDNISIFQLDDKDTLYEYKDPLNLSQDLRKSYFSNIFKAYFTIEDFKKEFALPIMTISGKKLLPVILKSSEKLIVFFELKDEYTNNNEKLKNLAENYILKIGWLWRNYNEIK